MTDSDFYSLELLLDPDGRQLLQAQLPHRRQPRRHG